MNYRKLGGTDIEVSEVSLGTWQVGGGWGGGFDEKAAAKILHEAVDGGVNFIDTADVYDDGKSEAAVGRLLKERSEQLYVASKCGRQINPHVSEGYTPEALRKYVEASLKNIGIETLDLIQLHCPPTAVYRRDEIFELFDRLKEEGKIKHLGVSVEKVTEAELALNYPNVKTVQIIFNMFRQKPADSFFELAKAKDVGVIVRVPLASGLLSGKMDRERVFDKNDHRHFNREGQAFDKGETFSGVDFEKGLEAVAALKDVLGEEEPLAAWALRWILMFDQVSTVIPGASRPSQVKANLLASALPALTAQQMEAVKAVYAQYIKPDVHHLW
ncbi:aldo/keto reductase [Echinicola vietnamensis]|uniref:Putative oxidoreductase, aryl-alcohol dehydrogenase like protein n=1 Tax=Echinicola vietnamensis (strain DSM 17526 / LMG 23754 / KMM 6221) TaxID=926556 RepID=L0G1M3_ECHVK|nr:aldo/keto reductase [Echinicola vietnamensis]AGA80094.1 putative oxidoreductase, aryl-alcohol dehydrogenase like protein [Echinicola vietnamensis DSM 17526]